MYRRSKLLTDWKSFLYRRLKARHIAPSTLLLAIAMIGQITAFALLLPVIPHVLADRSLAIQLSGSTEITGVDDLSVLVNITNTGDETLKLYKDPKSVLNDFPEDSFRFSIPDNHLVQRPRFIGGRVKYSLRTATQFVTLSPGHSIVVAHNFADAYEFEYPGTYGVSALQRFYFYNFDTQQPETIYADSHDAHNFKLSTSHFSPGDIQRVMYAGNCPRLNKKITFSGCTPKQEKEIQDAMPTAMDYISDAIGYLKGDSPDGKRFTTWFGTYSDSAKDKVLDHFERIQESDPASYTYFCSCAPPNTNCGCPSDYYAQVYENDFGKVYLCPLFWTADSTGTISKAGTFVHEASHFTCNGGTVDDDYGYGQENVTRLAIEHPERAIMNAESHEYFANNAPPPDFGL